MTGTWNNTKVADELHNIANAAAKLEIRWGNICRNAEPSIRLRMDKIDALDLDVIAFMDAATWFADKLQAEADASVDATE